MELYDFLNKQIGTSNAHFISDYALQVLGIEWGSYTAKEFWCERFKPVDTYRFDNPPYYAGDILFIERPSETWTYGVYLATTQNCALVAAYSANRRLVQLLTFPATTIVGCIRRRGYFSLP